MSRNLEALGGVGGLSSFLGHSGQVGGPSASLISSLVWCSSVCHLPLRPRLSLAFGRSTELLGQELSPLRGVYTGGRAACAVSGEQGPLFPVHAASTLLPGHLRGPVRGDGCKGGTHDWYTRRLINSCQGIAFWCSPTGRRTGCATLRTAARRKGALGSGTRQGFSPGGNTNALRARRRLVCRPQARPALRPSAQCTFQESGACCCPELSLRAYTAVTLLGVPPYFSPQTVCAEAGQEVWR